MENIEVVLSENELVVDVAKRYGVTHLVRGLRNATDLEYESSFDFTIVSWRQVWKLFI